MTATVYRWGELETDRPMALIERQRIVADKTMISRIVLYAGCVVPTHDHENEQIACVLSGRVRFGIGADDAPDHREETLGAGEVLVLPSGVPHSAEALEDSVVLDVFTPPSATTGVDHAGKG